MYHPFFGFGIPQSYTATALGKRTRSLGISKQALAATAALSKRARISPPASRLHIATEAPSPLLLFKPYLKRGIVPMLASSRDERFDWDNSTNIITARQHIESRAICSSLKSLIKSGRKYKGTTPGITIGDVGEGAIRYEYWPMFDECANEHEEVQHDRLRGSSVGKPLSDATVAELSEYFYRPAHIPETLDF